MASIIKADTLQSTTANVFVLNSSGTEYARFDSTGVFQLANPTTFPAGTVSLPSITATGDTNTGLYFPAADTIAFTEGGVESMRIDSIGNVGIGTTSPTALTSNKALTINSPTTFGSLVDLKTNEILNLRVFSNATNSGLSVKTATPLIFETNDTERLRIPADAAGIQFPAVLAASSNANTLDDYEEGTWTPTLANIGTGTYSTNTGSYTKIGNRVYLTVVLDINTTGTASGDLQINGFPFTTVSAEPSRSVSGNLLCGSWSSNGTPNIVFMTNNSTSATIQDNQGNTVRTHANMGTGSFRFDISYQTA